MSRGNSSATVQSSAIRTRRPHVGMYNRWYVRCRNHAGNPRTSRPTGSRRPCSARASRRCPCASIGTRCSSASPVSVAARLSAEPSRLPQRVLRGRRRQPLRRLVRHRRDVAGAPRARRVDDPQVSDRPGAAQPRRPAAPRRAGAATASPRPSRRRSRPGTPRRRTAARSLFSIDSSRVFVRISIPRSSRTSRA